MRPRYIQFRDIHDRDISGLHCSGMVNSIKLLVLVIMFCPHGDAGILKTSFVNSFEYIHWPLGDFNLILGM